MRRYPTRPNPIRLSPTRLALANIRLYIATLVVAMACSAGLADNLEEGFVSLFDGETFSGWIGATENYSISDGILSSKEGVYGGLYSEEEFANFELRFEFRLTKGANNGIALRAPLDGDPAYDGYEAQILDNTAEKYATLEPYQYHGSIYGIVPAKRGSLRPVGDWNEQVIRCNGSKIMIVLNGTPIIDTDLEQAAPMNKTMDGKDHPGLKRTAGHIGLMSHNDIVDFRNIRIRTITTLDTASPADVSETGTFPGNATAESLLLESQSNE